MKRFIRPVIILTISLFLALVSAAFTRTNSVQSSKFSGSTSMAMFFQITTTPHPKGDRSEVGSTDNITTMSFVIVAIIIIPIFLQKKYWSQI